MSKLFTTKRCVNPECKTPDKEFIWNPDEFLQNKHDWIKQLEICLCDNCKLVAIPLKDRSDFLKLKNQVENFLRSGTANRSHG
jgi:hypothetical protein